MGKIFSLFSNFSLSTGSHGTKASYIMDILNHLPGETYVLGFSLCANQSSLKLEMENFSFSDGTEIIIKYNRKQVVGHNGVTVLLDFFDGLEIIPPAIATANTSIHNQNAHGIFPTAAPISSMAPSTLTMPTIIISHFSIDGVPINYPAGDCSISWDYSLSNGKTKCSCGAEKAGGKHYDYCDIKN